MNKIIPILADLRQDIAGPVPVELIKTWVNSDQTDAVHEEILAPYKKEGYMVSSDASGLSRLSEGKPLIEVMKLVSDPKEVIFHHGRSINGQAVGIWAADNTQMFYDKRVDANHLVERMILAQRTIQETCKIRIGMGIHKGSVYEIGGGLYGGEADLIEDYTEDESNANEIIVSPVVFSELHSDLQKSTERDGMHILQYEDMDVPAMAGDTRDEYYPAPFDRAFHEALRTLDEENEQAIQSLHEERVKQRTIVLFRAFLGEEHRLLDRLTQQVFVSTVVHNVARRYETQVVKSNGMLAILSCETIGEGADLAIALMQAAQEQEITANIGISRGEVLIFDLGNDTYDLAGGPVNLASKLAEDTQERGKIYFEGEEAQHAERHGLKTSFERTISGVTINGIMN